MEKVVIFGALFGPVVQMVRTPACHAGGREFESRPDRSYKAASSQGVSGFFIVFFKKQTISDSPPCSHIPVGNAVFQRIGLQKIAIPMSAQF